MNSHDLGNGFQVHGTFVGRMTSYAFTNRRAEKYGTLLSITNVSPEPIVWQFSNVKPVQKDLGNVNRKIKIGDTSIFLEKLMKIYGKHKYRSFLGVVKFVNQCQTRGLSRIRGSQDCCGCSQRYTEGNVPENLNYEFLFKFKFDEQKKNRNFGIDGLWTGWFSIWTISAVNEMCTDWIGHAWLISKFDVSKFETRFRFDSVFQIRKNFSPRNSFYHPNYLQEISNDYRFCLDIFMFLFIMDRLIYLLQTFEDAEFDLAIRNMYWGSWRICRTPICTQKKTCKEDSKSNSCKLINCNFFSCRNLFIFSA